MIFGQVVKNLDASGDHRRLQLRHFSVFHPRSIGEVPSRAADCRSQPGIGINLNAKAIGFSDHGC